MADKEAGRLHDKPARQNPDHDDEVRHQGSSFDGYRPALLDRHREELVAQAIDPAILNAVGVRSVEHADELPDGAPAYWTNYLPAKLYPWRLNGVTVWQLAPDDRTKHKYLFPDGGNGHQLGRRMRPVHDDHLPR